MPDRLVAATITYARNPIERRIATRTILAVARVARDQATSIDIAAILQSRLTRIADAFASGRSGDGSDAWQRTMAAMPRKDDALTRELTRAAPVFPPEMPI